MQNLDSQIWKSRISISTMLKLYNTCILPIFLYCFECCIVTKREVHKTDALNQWCLRKVLGIKLYHQCGMMMWDGKLSNHTIRLLFKHGASPYSATLHECQMNQMPSRSEQFPPWRTGGDHRDAAILCGWSSLHSRSMGASSSTWNQWTTPWTKQVTWLRIVHSGDWCLHLVLRTHSGACQKSTNEWIFSYCMKAIM